MYIQSHFLQKLGKYNEMTLQENHLTGMVDSRPDSEANQAERQAWLPQKHDISNISTNQNPDLLADTIINTFDFKNIQLHVTGPAERSPESL